MLLSSLRKRRFGSRESHSNTALSLSGDTEAPPLLLKTDGAFSFLPRTGALRWLFGAVLTGLTAFFLMGGALWLSLEGRYSHAKIPSHTLSSREARLPSYMESLKRVTERVFDSFEQEEQINKGDRLISSLPEEEQKSKQLIQVSMVHRKGGRDIIETRPHAFVTAPLHMYEDPEMHPIPPLDMSKILSNLGQEKEKSSESSPSESLYQAHVEGKISVVLEPLEKVTDLESVIFPHTPSREESAQKVLQQISILFPNVDPMTEDDSSLLASQRKIRSQYAPTDFDPERFDFERIQLASLTGLDVRIVPENMSFVLKNSRKEDILGLIENIVPLTQGTTFKIVLLEQDLPIEEIYELTSLFREEFDLVEAAKGQYLRLEYWGKAPSNKLQLTEEFDLEERNIPLLQRISIYDENGPIATLARTDRGVFKRATFPVEETRALATHTEQQKSSQEGPLLTLYRSLYQTALTQGIPESVIGALVRIYAQEFDLNAPVHRQDLLEIFYGVEKEEETTEESGEILYTGLKTGKQARRFYRFRTSDDGRVDYYDENGRSARNFLIRKPLLKGRYSSGFGQRRHPILGTRSFHTGVDWKAPHGSAVVAAGDGKVILARWSSGYGHRVEILHANGYMTTYSHLSRFAASVAEGKLVQQGQTIGYVGSTGLSTGPHLHFEVKINNRFVDPMRIRLPEGRVLKGAVLEAFRKEKERIDSLRNAGGSFFVAQQMRRIQNSRSSKASSLQEE